VRSLVSGTTPVVVDRLDPAQRNLAAFGCGYTSLVPAQLRRMLEAGAACRRSARSCSAARRSRPACWLAPAPRAPR